MSDADLARASARVAEIVDAAEHAAEQLRAQGERKMQERIAEGNRAAENRVKAAEAEALEVLSAAQDEADKVRESAREDACDIIGEARAIAREVLRDGTELSGNLRELSDSLRANAELLLRDVRLAHAEMTARLDQSGIPSGEDLRVSRGPAPTSDLDVPEFHPGRRGA
jgi:cell division septum initiation protein DivIVA